MKGVMKLDDSGMILDTGRVYLTGPQQMGLKDG